MQGKNIFPAIDGFLRLSKVLPNARLIIYGDGPLRDELQSYVEHFDINNLITIFGYCSDPSVIYSDSHVLLHPSLTEGTSRSTLEALSAHIPIIMLPILGSSFTISNDFNGLLVHDFSSLDFHVNSILELSERMSRPFYSIDYYLPPHSRLLNFKTCFFNLLFD